MYRLLSSPRLGTKNPTSVLYTLISFFFYPFIHTPFYRYIYTYQSAQFPSSFLYSEPAPGNISLLQRLSNFLDLPSRCGVQLLESDCAELVSCTIQEGLFRAVQTLLRHFSIFFNIEPL